jgi:hypothetical protein
MNPSFSNCPTVRTVFLPILQCAALVVAQATFALYGSSALGASGSLERAVVSADGDAQMVLEVTEAGWFSLRASSATGVAVRVVSRLMGPGDWSGAPGVRDGRQDLLLDVGRYAVHTRGAGLPGTKAGLLLVPAKELNETETPLPREQIVSNVLRDGEQRSFWVVQQLGEPLVVEAAGRSLAALRVWRDGQWLESVQPRYDVEQPQRDRPLRYARLEARLPAGRYRVTIYGGPALDWAGTAGDSSAAGKDNSPLHIRRGVPSLPVVYRGRHIASSFGVDRFRVKRGPSRFRLELPLPDTAAIGAGARASQGVFGSPPIRATIEPRSTEPVASVSLGQGSSLPNSGPQENIVTINRLAGEPYTLQLFHPARRLRLESSGRYHVETITEGPVRDALSPNAMAFLGPKGNRPHPLLAADVLALDRFAHWTGRFDLRRKAELLLRVDEGGRYTFTPGGSDAQYGLTPYGSPRKGSWKVRRPDGSGALLLKPGYYRFFVEPARRGIHTLTIGGAKPDEEARALPVVARFAAIDLPRGSEAVVQLSREGTVDAGLVVRRLPIGLEEPIALTLAPGDVLPLEVSTKSPRLAVTRPNHPDVVFRRAGGIWSKSVSLDGGTMLIEVQNRSLSAVQIQVGLAPDPVRESTEGVPTVSSAHLLNVDDSNTFAVARNGRVDHVLQINEDGFYRVETSGLLHLTGALDGMFTPAMWSGQGGSAGRNVALNGYLKAGHYRLRVGAVGNSAGSATVTLTRLAHAGTATLSEASRVRQELQPDQPLRIPVTVTETGKYRLSAMGLNHRFAIRLTDAAGWPVIRPGQSGEQRLLLAAGQYTLDVLPTGAPARLVATIEPISAPVARAGHGPHAITLNQTVSHRWLEPRPDAAPAMDEWRFSLPAAATVRIQASAGMAGSLDAAATGAGQEQVTSAVSPPTPSSRIGTLGSDGTLSATLAAGKYWLRLHHSVNANRVDYTVKVSTNALLPGERQSVKAPARLPVAVPASGRLILQSVGDQDVRARLLDVNGRVVALSDDTTNDWNVGFDLTLEPGLYTLDLTPAGAAEVATTVESRWPDGDSLAAPGKPGQTGESAFSPMLAVGESLSIEPSVTALNVSLDSDSQPGILRLRTRGDEGALIAQSHIAAKLPSQTILASPGFPANVQVRLMGMAQGAQLERMALPSTAGFRPLGGRGSASIPAGMTMPVLLPAGAKRLVLDLPAAVVVSVDGMTLGADHAARHTVLTRVRRIWLMNTATYSSRVALDTQAYRPSHDSVGHLVFANEGYLAITGRGLLPDGSMLLRGAAQSAVGFDAQGNRVTLNASGREWAASASGGSPIGARVTESPEPAAEQQSSPVRELEPKADAVTLTLLGSSQTSPLPPALLRTVSPSPLPPLVALRLAHGVGPVVWWSEGGTRHGEPNPHVFRANDDDKGLNWMSGDGEGFLQATNELSAIRLVSGAPMLFSLGHYRGVLHASKAAYVVRPAGVDTLRSLPLERSLPISGKPVVPEPASPGTAGTPLWVGPGESAVWSVRVRHDGPVGIAVRNAANEIVTLFDANGHVVSTGANQMPVLSAGTYLLMADNPHDAPPREFVAVITLARPHKPATPPASVVSTYSKEAGQGPDGQ